MNSSNPLQFKKCYIENFRVVAAHEVIPDLVFRFGGYYSQLSKNINGKLIQHQVAESDPPEIPRVSIQTNDMVIIFSLNKVEIMLKGDRKHNNISSLSNAYKSTLTKSKDIIDNYLRRDGFESLFIGIIGSVSFPQIQFKDRNELLNSLYLMFDSKKKIPSIATFEYRVGFLNDTNDKFLNYFIKHYEIKNIKIPQPNQSNGVHSINIDNFPTVEQGVSVTVDVNNRPSQNKGTFINEFQDLKKYFFSVIESFESYW